MIFSNELHSNIHQSFRLRQKEHKQPFTRIGHFMIGQILGKGGFASVFKAFQIYTKTEVAAKVINLDGLSKKQIHQLKMEIQIHGSLNHANIVRIYETVWTDSKLYIFMELIKGRELFEHIRKNGPIKEVFAAKIFYQICQAVKYLHEKGISHRDIKTENIMIDSQYNAKLIDFGLAKRFKPEQDEFFDTFCGSPSYTAPEMAERKKYKGTQIDLWCLGVSLYVMLEASLPFDHEGETIRKQNIILLNWEQIRYSSIEALEIYSRVFRRNQQRLTLEELLDSTFFQKYFLKNNSSRKLSMNDEQYAESLKQSSQVIKRVSAWLGISQQEAKNKLIQKELGQVSCLYELQNKKNQNQEVIQNKSVELRQPRRLEGGSRMQRRTIVYKKSQFQKASHPKTQCQTPKKNSHMKMLPLIKGQSFTSRLVTQKISRKKTGAIQTILNQKIGKQSIGLRNKFKSKQLLGRNIQIDFPKARLREESPQSPKRLIDCIKRYN